MGDGSASPGGLDRQITLGVHGFPTAMNTHPVSIPTNTPIALFIFSNAWRVKIILLVLEVKLHRTMRGESDTDGNQPDNCEPDDGREHEEPGEGDGAELR